MDLSRSDYNQYTVNQSVPVQPSVKISEVNTKQYQKPKKVAVNEADKYNLNQDVTVQDYDIYENQVGWKVFCRSFRKGSAYRESKTFLFSVSSYRGPRLSSTRTSSALPKASRSGEKIPLVNFPTGRSLRGCE